MKFVEKSKPAIERLDTISKKIKDIKKSLGPKYDIIRELKDQIAELDTKIDSSKKERDMSRASVDERKDEIQVIKDKLDAVGAKNAKLFAQKDDDREEHYKK
jgi:septal ring factor EnvC (AmiA/AmiB activator)